MAAAGVPLHAGQREGLPRHARVLQAGPARARAARCRRACSTSLVAVHLACQSLLAASATWRWPAASPSACRSAPATSTRRAASSRRTATAAPSTRSAQGTVLGSGVGVVVLKRLADALRDGDTDPRRHPGLGHQQRRRGQGRLHRAERGGPGRGHRRGARRGGRASPTTIGYVEAHGTATPLGDPIEVAGAARRRSAAREASERFCALGSVKSNIGHLDAAAGVAGLIKTVLALEHRVDPGQPALRAAPSGDRAWSGGPSS